MSEGSMAKACEFFEAFQCGSLSIEECADCGAVRLRHASEGWISLGQSDDPVVRQTISSHIRLMTGSYPTARYLDSILSSAREPL